MAFYLHHLPDKSLLPKQSKLIFLLKNCKDAVYIGTTLRKDFQFREEIIKGSVFKEIQPPTDFFQYINPDSKKSELVCIAEDIQHDAACWIDIPRQLEICSMPDDRQRHWLLVPDAYKMIKDEYDD